MRIQRRAYLVAHIGEEEAFQAVRFLGMVTGDAQCFFRAQQGLFVFLQLVLQLIGV